jgi:hypothetical protein
MGIIDLDDEPGNEVVAENAGDIGADFSHQFLDAKRTDGLSGQFNSLDMEGR